MYYLPIFAGSVAIQGSVTFYLTLLLLREEKDCVKTTSALCFCAFFQAITHRERGSRLSCCAKLHKGFHTLYHFEKVTHSLERKLSRDKPNELFQNCIFICAYTYTVDAFTSTHLQEHADMWAHRHAYSSCIHMHIINTYTCIHLYMHSYIDWTGDHLP